MDARRRSRFAFLALCLPLATKAVPQPLRGTAFSIEADGFSVDARFGPEAPSVPREALVSWVSAAARDVVSFLGRPPLRRVPLRIRTGGGGGIGSGRTFGGDGDASIRIAVGRRTTLLDLEQDWVLTHEFVHLALPDLPREQLWMEEGLATYVEPIARARRGRLSIAELWSGLVEGIPKGVAHVGGPGLDESDAWGSTYWGGALFWLMADVEIRERTGNRRGVADALAGIAEAGGNATVHWKIARLLAIADGAIGLPVLGALYKKMGPRPMPTDLQAYWQRLGVIERAQGVSFDDTAPLAAIRLEITARIPAPAVPPG
jgi:hypothetical protein